MTLNGWLLIAVFLLAVGVTIRPLGGYMAWIFTGQHASNRFLRGSERVFFRLAGIDPSIEQNWFHYAAALLIFNLAGGILLFAILIFQEAMPLNPQHLGPMAPDLALNTAVSFVTNTSWQAYAGETTLSDFSQMAGITVQSFLSAATGMAVAIAMVRGFARHGAETIGNAWVDLTRATLYVLLPLSVIGALFLARQGVPQTLSWSGYGSYSGRCDSRSSRAGRSLRRRRSSSSAAMAVVFSTPILRIRSKIRRR